MLRMPRSRYTSHLWPWTPGKHYWKQWRRCFVSTVKIFKIYTRRSSSRAARIDLLLYNPPSNVRHQHDLQNSGQNLYNAKNLDAFCRFVTSAAETELFEMVLKPLFYSCGDSSNRDDLRLKRSRYTNLAKQAVHFWSQESCFNSMLARVSHDAPCGIWSTYLKWTNQMCNVLRLPRPKPVIWAVPADPIERFCSVWNRTTCCIWSTSFASSPSPEGWLWSPMLKRSQFQRPVCFPRCIDSLWGAAWSWSVSLRVSSNCPSNSFDMNSMRCQLLPGMTMCSKQLSHLLKPWMNWSLNITSIYGRGLLVFQLHQNFRYIYSAFY